MSAGVGDGLQIRSVPLLWDRWVRFPHAPAIISLFEKYLRLLPPLKNRHQTVTKKDFTRCKNKENGSSDRSYSGWSRNNHSH